jgi:hypothetical protein
MVDQTHCNNCGQRLPCRGCLERDVARFRDLLVRLTSATSISQFHALLCEAKEQLGAAGVDVPRADQSKGGA